MTRVTAQLGGQRTLASTIRSVLARAAVQRNLIGAVSLAVGAATTPLSAQELPNPCAAGACGPGVTSFSNGAATIGVSGNTMNVNQSQSSAVLNWQSFNIGANNTVNFQQPSSTSVALNRIYQSDPSRIFGSLNANGRVYLLNQNGIVFGGGSQVNVAGLIASSLNVSDYALENGISQAALDRRVAFQLFDNDAATGDVSVLEGANITTSEGGQVLMFAPNVVNAGTIRTPGGQTILAAGTSIYLYDSGDANLRGMFVEVGSGNGTVTNGVASNAGVTDPQQLVGQIAAERGNVTLAAMAVNQLGRISATTSVTERGSIRLLARSGSTIDSVAAGVVQTVSGGPQGTLIVGAHSQMDIALDESGAKIVDATSQPQSLIELDGNKVILEDGAKIIAPHGNVEITARNLGSANALEFSSTADSDARIYIGRDTLIDVSGANIESSMESNVISVELRGDELANSDIQRNGALRGQTAQIDIRESGTQDGMEWVGSPIGDLQGWVGNIEKGVGERSLTGGTVSLSSQGDVILDTGSKIDISGGSISFAGGIINTSLLLGADGGYYDIASADPNRVYTGIQTGGSISLSDSRWGVTRTYSVLGLQGRHEDGYVEGKDAGTVSILGQRVVMNGDINAQVTAGRYQRNLATEFGGVNPASLYRPYNELPLSGQLIVGQTNGTAIGTNSRRDYQLGNVRFGNEQSPLPAAFDPLGDSLSSEFDTLVLNTNLLGVNRIGRLVIRANGAIDIPTGVAVELPVQGTLDLLGGTVSIGGAVVAHSGNIKLTSAPTAAINELAGGLSVQRGAVIDTSGMWVNDTPIANGGLPGNDLLAINGGTIALTASQNSLRLESGSLLDASDGAQLTASGRFIAGRAGSISLSQTPTDSGAATSMVVDGELRANGFNSGGQLSISTAAICVTSSAGSCGESARENLLVLTPQFFNSGFSSYALSSNQGGIEVSAGTQVSLQQSNRVPTAALFQAGTGADLSRATTLELLPIDQRGHVDLSMTVAPVLPIAERTFSADTFANAGSLIIARGASIRGDVGARINLTTSTRLLVDGAIDAPAGEISLQLTPDLPLAAVYDSSLYFADQGIWLGNNASLTARGAVVLTPNDFGNAVGEVLDGGTIRIDADRGHVLLSAGSLLDVSGTSANLAIKSDVHGGYGDTLIGSRGGTIDVEASEGIALGGSMRGASGLPGQVAAGSLRVSLDPSARLDPGLTGEGARQSVFPVAQRTIEVTQNYAPVAFSDSRLPSELQGRATVSSDQIAAGGFDAVELSAQTFVALDQPGLQQTHFGTVIFSGNVDLALGRRLTINSASLDADGGAVHLAAPIVRLGNFDVGHQEVPAAVGGTGTLRIDTQQLDVYGSSVLNGFSEAELYSSGDIRLIGAARPGESLELLGSLTAPGSLTLSASQIYPTTLSNFVVTAGAGGEDTLTILGNGNRPGDALSAGGQLTLRGANVVQSGMLRAPFGSITIDAPSITLSDGSVTSTSGNGMTVPFGETQGGVDWAYILSGQTLLYGTGANSLPAQTVTLSGDNIQIAAGSTVDVRGGGQLQASEFIPGPTGKVDILGSGNSGGYFAILPANSLSSAAYDPSIYGSLDSAGATSVHLSGSGQLPQGDYIVLPARYALLPGAYLVRQVSGHQDITASESYALSDGSAIVSGYFFNTGTTLRDARTSGFAVLDGGRQNKARYTAAVADEFFAARAQEANAIAQRLPRDAGTLSILANTSLELNGTLAAGAANGNGRGAALDIASSSIRLVADGDTSTVSGVLSVKASDIAKLGAESVLIGGMRTENAEAIVIATSAQSVVVDSGARLEGAEVILVGTDRVQVAGGAAIAASGQEALAKDIELSGDGAFLRVATSSASIVDRVGSNDSSSATLQIDAGAIVSANTGSVSLESSGGATLLGALAVTGGELSLTGSRINIGTPTTPTSGLTLAVSQLPADSDKLSLNSRSSIDFYGDIDLELSDLQLRATTLRGFNDGNVRIEASGDVTLIGTQDTLGGAAAGSGSFEIRSDRLLLEGGRQTLSGFTRLGVDVGDIYASRSSELVVNGDLLARTNSIATGSGVDLAVGASGSAQLFTAQVAAEANNGAPDAALGGSVSVTASSVNLATRVDAHAGIVRLTATGPGGITLGDGANIDTSGRMTDFQGTAIDSGGGVVSLVSQGALSINSGATVNVSAAQDGAAGSIELFATQGAVTVGGSLVGSSDIATQGGSLSVDAQSLTDFAGLNRLLNSGGLTGERSVRLRGAGDIVVASGDQDTIQGTAVSLTADQGSVIVDGNVRVHDVDGGRIAIAARDGIVINGSLDARALDDGERNGRIALDVGQQGQLTVSDGATIATTSATAHTGSAADGAVALRVSQASLATVLDADSANDRVRLAGDWTNVREVNLEGYKVYRYDQPLTTIGSTDVVANTTSAYFADAQAFTSNQSLVPTLQNSTMASLNLLAGIEIESTGDMQLSSNWDLSAWRFNGRPGVLTLRSGGNLTFNASLSDGFTGVTGNSAFVLSATDQSWSYRLVAGADLGSAATNATVGGATGSLTVSGGTPTTTGYRMIRTGTGGIDISAANDVILTNSSSMIYTAGIATDGMIYSTTLPTVFGNELSGLKYPASGGDISIQAGRDVKGAVGNQLITDWLWRIGNSDSSAAANTRSTAWTVNFASFRQNVGALGGGDVTVDAGRDVVDLSVSTPSIGRQRSNPSNDKTFAANNLEVIGGGNVIVSAVRDVNGGVFYSGLGTIDIAADRSIGASATTNLRPILALGDTRAVVGARLDAAIETILTPTLLPQGTSQGTRGVSTSSNFSTYSEESSAVLTSIAGDVSIATSSHYDTIKTQTTSFVTSIDTSAAQIPLVTRLLPGTVSLLSLRGDVNVEGDMTLVPTGNGHLDLLAYNDVHLGEIVVSDADRALLPGINNAVVTFGNTSSIQYRALTGQGIDQDLSNARVPVRLAASVQGTLQPSQIVAATGNVVGSTDASKRLYFGAPVDVYAGRDVTDLNLIAQNLIASDVTSIEAGRDIIYNVFRTSGTINANDREVAVDGPGHVSFVAGRNINLQNSAGISTRGNLVNEALANDGAGISMLAGLNGRSADYTGFVQTYLRDSTRYEGLLAEFIKNIDGTDPGTHQLALTRFDALSANLKAALLHKILLAELRGSAEYAASADPDKHGDYSRGFAALDKLFPDSGVGDNSNAYFGDILLYFSRVYTRDGGDIALLTPGGGVNAGLATPPTAFGIKKASDQLGIVTQVGGDIGIFTNRDLQVNESRVFAINNSDIVVWSANGDIDAGRGAKTAISAPTPVIAYDTDGRPTVTYSAALAGSGIQTRATTASFAAGDVVLAAPRGVVNASDAGIVAGNLTIAATAVLGADNIKVGGVAVGVPVDTGGLGASLSGVSNAAGSATNAATTSVGSDSTKSQHTAPIAESALSWLEVFVVGLGEDACKQDDIECLKRQK